MNLRIRRVLTALFFLLFLVSAPPIILSTAGYRYNLLKNRLERTGVVFISSKPSNVKIFLNDKEFRSKTPTRIKRILPGKYTIRLEREGFHSWKKNIEIRSKETVFLNNIILFKKSVPALRYEISADTAKFSRGQRYASAITNKPSGTELHLIDLRTNKSWIPFRKENASEAEISLSWSPGSDRLLVKVEGETENNFFIWDSLKPEKLLPLKATSPLPYTQAFWSNDGSILFAATEQHLYDLDTRGRTTIQTGPAVQKMRVINNLVFGLFYDKGETVLVRRKLEGSDFTVLGPLPAGDYRHIYDSTKRITLLNESSGKIILIDPKTVPNELRYFEANGRHATWSKDGKKLLYWNDLELRKYNTETNIDELVTRRGTPIKQSRWYPEQDIILYSDDKSVYAIEGTDLVSLNIIQISKFSSLYNYGLNTSGTQAWFLGSIGNQKGIWTMEVR